MLHLLHLNSKIYAGMLTPILSFPSHQSSSELFRELHSVGGFTESMLAAGCSLCKVLGRGCQVPSAQ